MDVDRDRDITERSPFGLFVMAKQVISSVKRRILSFFFSPGELGSQTGDSGEDREIIYFLKEGLTHADSVYCIVSMLLHILSFHFLPFLNSSSSSIYVRE
jgi:hypothetical protein